MDKPAIDRQHTGDDRSSGPQRGTTATARSRSLPTYAWWLVLCLVGLDYFSTLGYLPTTAAEDAGVEAPFAALFVVAITLFVALPVYLYIVGRSPHGEGATGLLERHVTGWGGKILILVLLGFVATDFVITRTLSVADASKHLTQNPYWQSQMDALIPSRESLKERLPSRLHGSLAYEIIDWWNEQLSVSVILTVLGFGLYFYLLRGFTRSFMIAAGVIVASFLLLNGIVVGSGLVYLAHNPGMVTNWMDLVRYGSSDLDTPSLIATLTLFALQYFPQMALGLSGFELSMASAPLVRGKPGDDPDYPRGRIRNARLLLVASAVIMSVFVVGSVLTVTLLVPRGSLTEADGPARYRALAYLAHGGALQREGARVSTDNPHERPEDQMDEPEPPADMPAVEANPVEQPAEPPPAPPTARDLNPLFGPVFGTLYDLSTILILSLAGASVTISLRDLVPRYLARYGMELHWAHRIGLILHLFNVVILVVIVVFHASVSQQQGAYATSVLVLLGSAALAAIVDLRSRWRRSLFLPIVTAPLVLACVFFLLMAFLAIRHSPAGAIIPLLIVAVVFVTAGISRWARCTELRFDGFLFADEHSQKRWNEISQLEFQVLVPHRPGGETLAEKDAEIRARHRLAPDVPIIFIEARLGDPSNFQHHPRMQIVKENGMEVIRLTDCASISHVLAAIALEFREVGRPPEIHFGWSDESPIASNMSFLLLGEGNVPWMVHALLRKAEGDPLRRPRVVIG
jgi:drug/metabolite transporter (DMT)-like permease